MREIGCEVLNWFKILEPLGSITAGFLSVCEAPAVLWRLCRVITSDDPEWNRTLSLKRLLIWFYENDKPCPNWVTLKLSGLTIRCYSNVTNPQQSSTGDPREVLCSILGQCYPILADIFMVVLILYRWMNDVLWNVPRCFLPNVKFRLAVVVETKCSVPIGPKSAIGQDPLSFLFSPPPPPHSSNHCFES